MFIKVIRVNIAAIFLLVPFLAIGSPYDHYEANLGGVPYSGYGSGVETPLPIITPPPTFPEPGQPNYCGRRFGGGCVEKGGECSPGGQPCCRQFDLEGPVTCQEVFPGLGAPYKCKQLCKGLGTFCNNDSDCCSSDRVGRNLACRYNSNVSFVDGQPQKQCLPVSCSDELEKCDLPDGNCCGVSNDGARLRCERLDTQAGSCQSNCEPAGGYCDNGKPCCAATWRGEPIRCEKGNKNSPGSPYFCKVQCPEGMSYSREWEKCVCKDLSRCIPATGECLPTPTPTLTPIPTPSMPEPTPTMTPVPTPSMPEPTPTMTPVPTPSMYMGWMGSSLW